MTGSQKLIAECYTILSTHWPNFGELLETERRRQLRLIRFDHLDQHGVQIADDDHWPDAPLLVAGGAQ